MPTAAWRQSSEAEAETSKGWTIHGDLHQADTAEGPRCASLKGNWCTHLKVPLEQILRRLDLQACRGSPGPDASSSAPQMRSLSPQ